MSRRLSVSLRAVLVGALCLGLATACRVPSAEETSSSTGQPSQLEQTGTSALSEETGTSALPEETGTSVLPEETGTPVLAEENEPAPERPPIEPCRLPLAGFTSVGLGVPRYEGLVPSVGTVTMAVVFADFDDAEATRSPEEVLAILDPTAADFFADNSYGRLTLELKPHLEWVRMSQPSAAYGDMIRFGDTHCAFIQEGIDLADPAFDFRGTDVVLVVANPDASAIPYGPVANSLVPEHETVAEGVSFPSGITSGFDLNVWGGLWLVHEAGHTMSLADLYAYEPGAAGSVHPYVGGFGIMGDIAAASPGFFAFERWMMGWLDDEQIYCHTSGSATFELAPIELAGGPKAVIVPIGQTQGVVVESRRRIGYDSSMANEGALVYVVDTAEFSGFGPILVSPGLDTGPNMEQAPLGPGQSYTYDNVTITVLAAGSDGDTVQVDLAE